MGLCIFLRVNFSYFLFQDVLANEDINLDMMFMTSFARDIVKVLVNIHLESLILNLEF